MLLLHCFVLAYFKIYKSAVKEIRCKSSVGDNGFVFGQFGSTKEMLVKVTTFLMVLHSVYSLIINRVYFGGFKEKNKQSPRGSFLGFIKEGFIVASVFDF